MTITLEITDLIKSFPQPDGGSIQVLDIPRLVVNEGEQVALIGQSGGGKTTLLHLIAGLLSADGGSISVDGINLTKLSEQGRDRFRAHSIGYVFQTFNLLPAFTALENVRLGMTFGTGKTDNQRARELLNRVGLSERENYRPSQLSVGQQQRVAIARAMAAKPRLLLADEPTANIDPKSAESVLDLIGESCSNENIALLMVTHDMQIASRFGRTDRLDEINLAGPKSQSRH
ncbi:MAG: ABC transporter ATP-binding protein [Planctomycetota bacterium]|nr:ABC transporter ATP-binding protein [Planctomycetota bacterium]